MDNLWKQYQNSSDLSVCIIFKFNLSELKKGILCKLSQKKKQKKLKIKIFLFRKKMEFGKKYFHN